MNSAHVHLLLNHVPLFATFFGLCILLYGLWLRNTTAQYIAMAFFILAALVTIPVMLSGEGAEEIVEHMPKVSKATIEPHEEAAEGAAWIAGGVGVLAALYIALRLIFKRNYGLLALGIFLAGMLSFGFMFRTAQLGGKIMHTEIQDTGDQVQAGDED